MSIFKKLQEARLELQESKLKKSGYNKFAGYDYFELHDFLPAAQEILNRVGLCGTMTFTSEIASLAINGCDENGGVIYFEIPMSSASLKGCHDIQNTGAVISYMRRYLWMLALEIVENDQLDANTGKQESRSENPQDNEKPWYNNDQFDSERELMRNDIKAGITNADGIISSLSQNYRLSKKIREQIKMLEG